VLVVPVCRLIAKFAGLMASQPELTNVKVTPLQPLATALFKPRSHNPVSYQYDDALMGHTFSFLPPVLAATGVKQDMVPSSPAKPPTALRGKEEYESTTRAVQVGFLVVVLVVVVVVVLVVVVVVVLVVVVVVVVVILVVVVVVVLVVLVVIVVLVVLVVVVVLVVIEVVVVDLVVLEVVVVFVVSL
jgi:hypothetical protein